MNPAVRIEERIFVRIVGCARFDQSHHQSALPAVGPPWYQNRFPPPRHDASVYKNNILSSRRDKLMGGRFKGVCSNLYIAGG
jgi:hypothetical protein